MLAPFVAGALVGVVGTLAASFVGGLILARRIGHSDSLIEKARQYPPGSPEWRQCLADAGLHFIPTEEANQALKDAVAESAWTRPVPRSDWTEREEETLRQHLADGKPIGYVTGPDTGLFQSTGAVFAEPYDPAEDPYDPLVNVVALADDLADRSAPARARHAANASLGDTHDAVLDYSPEEECADRSEDRHRQALRRVLARHDDGSTSIDYA